MITSLTDVLKSRTNHYVYLLTIEAGRESGIILNIILGHGSLLFLKSCQNKLTFISMIFHAINKTPNNVDNFGTKNIYHPYNIKLFHYNTQGNKLFIVCVATQFLNKITVY
mgnify:CR=1 FL=1